MTNSKVKNVNRVLSVILSILILLACLPITVMAQADTRIVDPSTLDEWKNYFGPDVISTENAGGIWADKSVFKDNSELPLVTMDDEDNNFLVALSAIAANKSITGYSHIPTDTMLVLDISASMNSNNNDAVDELIAAANSAITKLQEVNKHNRVGVVLYSGNSATNQNADDGDSIVLLPLDRYSHATNTFLKKDTLNYTESIIVNTGVTAENTSSNQFGKETAVDGGTYIQGGIYKAMLQFLGSDTVINEGGFQEGVTRLPIMVLMSDGLPTIATNDYDGTGTGIGTSNMGDGSTPSNHLASAIPFVTQLTASYAKERIAEHYGCTPLFYTLGFKVDNSPVLDPENSSDAIKNHWTTYNNTAANSSMQLAVGTRQNNRTIYTSVAKSSYDLSMNYVDGYFHDNSLLTAFDKIVEEIILQSLYYPTYVEDSENDLSGYIEFYDNIGEYMEVKSIKGILLGEHLFTGQMLAENFSGGSLGTIQSPTALGITMVSAVKTRLGIADNQTAFALIQKAWDEQQLYYNAETDEYSNYIAWYADADGNYMDFASKYDTEYPNGAKFINYSYGFLGEVVDGHKASDMMFVSVQIHNEIATGKSAVIFKVPASLIPVISYNVTLEGESLEDPGSITLEYDDKMQIDADDDGIFETQEQVTPIRLVYEVGLKDEINELTVSDPNVVSSNYAYVQDGNYNFYTNAWDADDVPADDHRVAENTIVYFEPSKENERFYYTENSTIYVLDNGDYAPYTGAVAPAYEQGKFFRAITVFEFNDDVTEGNARIQTHYEAISAAALSQAQPDVEGNANPTSTTEWYVPRGIIHTMLDQYHNPKGEFIGGGQTAVSGNNTDTLIYSHYVDVVVNDGESGYYSTIILGNNGLTTVKAAQGIKVSKQVDATLANTDYDYTFIVTDLDGVADGEYRLRSFNADGTEKPTATVEFDGGVLELTLKAGESAYLIDLPTGANFTVTEGTHTDYKVLSINGQDVTAAQVQIEEYKIAAAEFVNTAIPPEENATLVISKRVEHPFADDYLANLIEENQPIFTFEITVDDEQPFTVDLVHGETATFTEIPIGAQVTIKEYNPDGFTSNYPNDTYTFTALDVENYTVEFVNTYTPDEVQADNITVEVNKDFTGRADDEWLDTDEFTFRLEKWVDGNWQVINIGGALSEVTVDKDDKSADFNEFIQSEVYDEVGRYSYRISEVFTTNPYKGITYDRSVRWFNVVVTDNDMDGKLEISDVIGYQGAEVAQGGTQYNVSATFENTYASTGSDAVTIVINKQIFDTTVDNQADSTVSKAGFLFGLYQYSNLVATFPATLENTGETLLTLNFGAADIGNDIEYVIKEIVPDTPIDGMIYTTLEYFVFVTVEDDTEGGVIATVTVTDGETTDSGEQVEIVFENTYNPEDATVTISGEKTLAGRDMEDGEFTFELYYNGGIIDTAENVDGKFTFDTLTFDKTGEYTYTVKEQAGDDGTIGYDDAEYTVVITVTDEDGTLVASVEADEIVFNNVYEPPFVPDTGNNTNIWMWVALMFVSGMGIVTATVFGRKKEETEA